MRNKLVLGSAQFGLDYGINNQDGQVKIKEARKILHFAKKNEINTIDTASAYGDSEQVLGKLGVNEYKIITKTIPFKDSINEVIDGFYKSLKKLNIAQIEGLLIHNIDDVNNKIFILLFERLNELKKEGLVKKIGFSTYMPEQVDFLLENFDFDLIQLPVNIFDVRLIEGGQLHALKNKGVEVHARSVFLQGVLLDFDHLSSHFITWQDQFEKYQIGVKDCGMSLLEYALNFVLNIQEIDKVVVGVNSETQLAEIIQSINKSSIIDPYPINDINLLNPSLWKI